MTALMEALLRAIEQPQWLIALDRDGTLVPYADRPEQATVDESLRHLMDKLPAVSGFLVAIISARSAAQLQGDFPGQNLIFAGNYGMEIKFPDGSVVVQPEALAARPRLKEFRDELATRLKLDSGAILEDHGYSLCLHWHQVPDSEREQLHEKVQALTDSFPALLVRRLPTSYEVLPQMPWDKGRAIDSIDSITEDGSHRFYFYAGDSEADMKAFRWVNERGGISVRVGPDDNLDAQFRLDAPSALQAVLEQLVLMR